MKHSRKLTLIFLLSLIGISTFSQSKKKQIDILKFKLDSSSKIIENERQINSELTKRIFRFQRNGDSLNQIITFQKAQLESRGKIILNLDNEINSRNEEIIKLKVELNLKSDSLKLSKQLLVKNSFPDETSKSCWYGINKVDTLTAIDSSKLFVVPIDSNEYLSAYKGVLPNYINDKSTEANKKFIKFHLRNGTTKMLHNDLGPQNGNFYDAYVKFKLIGSIKEFDYYLLERINCEWSTFLLVDKENGREIKLCSKPIFTSDNRHMVCALFSEIQGFDFQIFKVQESGKITSLEIDFNAEWAPNAIKFNGTNEVLIQKSLVNCPDFRYGKVKLN